MSTIKENLVEMFELDKLPPEKALEMINRLSKLVFQAVLVRTLPLLSEEDFNEYERIIDANEGGEVLFKFLGQKVPDFENMVKEETENLKKELAGEFESAQI
ncbi:MAG: hypothetical protein QG583_58 [Patescibacteria group bacterium]|nr:hypothetical protein [Patescibacteria group bacterium]